MGNDKISSLKKIGVFRACEARKHGLSNSGLYRLVERGELIRLDTGFYIHSQSSLDPAHFNFALACKKFGPEAFIGGLSALFYHGLIEQVPDRVWVMVPPSIRTTSSLFLLIRTRRNLKVGALDKKHFRISGVERSLVESLGYGTKVGHQSALSAIRYALKEQRTKLSDLLAMSKTLGMKNILIKNWDAITLE